MQVWLEVWHSSQWLLTIGEGEPYPTTPLHSSEQQNANLRRSSTHFNPPVPSDSPQHHQPVAYHLDSPQLHQPVSGLPSTSMNQWPTMAIWTVHSSINHIWTVHSTAHPSRQPCGLFTIWINSLSLELVGIQIVNEVKKGLSSRYRKTFSITCAPNFYSICTTGRFLNRVTLQHKIQIRDNG